MKYQVNYLPEVITTLKRMDFYTKCMIMSWINKYIVDSKDPRIYGEPLIEEKENQWRYRVGEYRLVSKIEDGCVAILFISIAHRKIVYQK